jgi:long-chain fatty acid transport protein
MPFTHLRPLGLAGLFLLLETGSASAAAFMVRENSPANLATVFAGAASRADEASTVFNNPAGMALLRGTHFQVGSSVVLPDIHFTGSANFAGTPVPGVNNRNVGQVAMIPFIYGSFQVSDRVNAGIAVTVPFGNTINYSEDWPGRYVNIKTAAMAVDINPNVSYRITDRLSVAAGVSAQYLKLQLSMAIPQFVALGPGTPDGGFLLTADDWAWGYNLGVLYMPTDLTKIGVTYRSGIAHHITGRLDIWPTTSPLLGLTTAPGSAGINTPASTTVSVTQQITPEFSLSSDVQFSQWHTFREVTAVAPPNPSSTFLQNYRDSWMFSVGGVYRYRNNWRFRGGVGFDQSPVRDGFRDTGVPDKDRYMVGLGIGYDFSEKSGIDLGYAHYFAAGRGTMNESVNRLDHVFGVELNGSYKSALDYISLGYRTSW